MNTPGGRKVAQIEKCQTNDMRNAFASPRLRASAVGSMGHFVAAAAFPLRALAGGIYRWGSSSHRSNR